MRVGAGATLVDTSGANGVTISNNTNGDSQPKIVELSNGEFAVVHSRGTQAGGETPFEQVFLDQDVPAGEWGTYRVEVRGEGEILSNPIFVGPVPGSPAAA